MENLYHETIAEALKNGIDVHGDHVVKKGAGAPEKFVPVEFFGIDKGGNLVFKLLCEDSESTEFFAFKPNQRTRKILLTRIELLTEYTPGADYAMTP